MSMVIENEVLLKRKEWPIFKTTPNHSREDSFVHTQNTHTSNMNHQLNRKNAFVNTERKNMKRRRSREIIIEKHIKCVYAMGYCCVQFCVNHLRHLFFRQEN